jgi:hypothetical protein
MKEETETKDKRSNIFALFLSFCSLCFPGTLRSLHTPSPAAFKSSLLYARPDELKQPFSFPAPARRQVGFGS